MIENLASRLCESRHRWLIVTGVTFVIALASVLPQVDLFLAERSERADLEEQLAQAQRISQQLPTYEARVAEKLAELAKLHDRQVNEEQQATLRSWLVSVARQSGCQVRRIDMSAANTRSWLAQDDPISPPDKDTTAPKTPFNLQTRPIALSVTGSSAEVLALLGALDTDRRLKHIQSIDLKSTNRNAHELQLDLTLWYFALVRPAGVA